MRWDMEVTEGCFWLCLYIAIGLSLIVMGIVFWEAAIG